MTVEMQHRTSGERQSWESGKCKSYVSCYYRSREWTHTHPMQRVNQPIYKKMSAMLLPRAIGSQSPSERSVVLSPSPQQRLGGCYLYQWPVLDLFTAIVSITIDYALPCTARTVDRRLIVLDLLA